MQATSAPIVDLRITQAARAGIIGGVLDGGMPFQSERLTDELTFGSLRAKGYTASTTALETADGFPSFLKDALIHKPTAAQDQALDHVLTAFTNAGFETMARTELPQDGMAGLAPRIGQIAIQSMHEGGSEAESATGWLLDRNDPKVAPLLDALRGLHGAAGFHGHASW